MGAVEIKPQRNTTETGNSNSETEHYRVGAMQEGFRNRKGCQPHNQSVYFRNTKTINRFNILLRFALKVYFE